MTWSRLRWPSGWFEWRTGVLFVMTTFMSLSSFGATLVGAESAAGPAHHRAPLVAIGLVWVVVSGAVARRRSLTAEQAWALLLLANVVVTTCALSVPDARWRWLCAASMQVLPVLAVMHQRGWRLWSLQLATAGAVGLVLLNTDLTESYLAFALGFTVPLAVVPSVVVAALAQALERSRALAERAAQTDPLTGLLNRNGMVERAPGVLRAAVAEGHRAAVLLLDVDRFKAVNDTWGHAAGDRLLQAVAGAVCSQVRQCDVVVRHGGEELAVVTQLGDDERLAALAQRVRGAVSSLLVAGLPPVTVSIGTASASPDDAARALSHERGSSEGARELVGKLLDRADGALYAAKEGGRDRVVHSTRALAARPSPSSSPLPRQRAAHASGL